MLQLGGLLIQLAPGYQVPMGKQMHTHAHSFWLPCQHMLLSINMPGHRTSGDTILQYLCHHIYVLAL